MSEEKKKKIKKLPKNFFQISRPNVSMKETLNDVTPIEWEQKSKEIIVHSVKENKAL